LDLTADHHASVRIAAGAVLVSVLAAGAADGSSPTAVCGGEPDVTADLTQSSGTAQSIDPTWRLALARLAAVANGPLSMAAPGSTQMQPLAGANSDSSLSSSWATSFSRDSLDVLFDDTADASSAAPLGRSAVAPCGATRTAWQVRWPCWPRSRWPSQRRRSADAATSSADSFYIGDGTTVGTQMGDHIGMPSDIGAECDYGNDEFHDRDADSSGYLAHVVDDERR